MADIYAALSESIWQSLDLLSCVIGLENEVLARRLIILKKLGLVEHKRRSVMVGRVYQTSRTFWKRRQDVTSVQVITFMEQVKVKP